MLRLLNAQRQMMPPVTTYTDLRIERVLDYDDRTLYFSVPVCAMPEEMKLENYIRTKEDEYVIKQINLNDDSYKITAQLNVEELEGTHFDTFTSTEQTIVQAMNLAFAGTGWRCESSLTKKRTIKKTNASAWEILKQAVKTYRVEPVIDSLNKVVTFVEKRGSDRGVYFSSQLNLKSVGQQAQTTDFYTRIIPVGKDGLTIESVNNGIKYLEDHTYSPKVKTYYWKDGRYTVPESLMEDAKEKLYDLAHPVVAYTCDVINLAKVSRKYSILQYSLGDTVLVIDKHTKIRVQQRIVKMNEYPDNPEQNTCEISNVKLSFEEYVQRYENTSDTVDNITTDNGTVDGDAIDSVDAAKVQHLDEVIANSAKFVEVNTKILNVSDMLTAANAKIGTLETTKLTAADADLKYATIQNLSAATGRIDTLETNALTAGSALIHSLTSDVANINTLMFGTASGGSLTTDFANSVVSMIGTAQIKDSMIDSLDAKKIKALDIDTTDVAVHSKDGLSRWSDNTIQISDSKRVRVQIGKDVSGDYNMYVWDKAGNLMFDALGLTEKGVQREIIRNDMVKEDAGISASKLDIGTLFDVINNDGSHTLKSSKIYVDSDKQTLDIAFKNMTTTVSETAASVSDAIKTAEAANTNAGSALNKANSVETNLKTISQTVSSQGTQLSTVQGQISSKIWQQDITTAVNSIEIGGRNLVKDSSTLQGYFYIVGGYAGTRTVVTDSDAKSGIHIEFKCTTAGNGFFCPVFPKTTDRIGKTFTWSFWAKCSVAKSGTIGHESGGLRTCNLTTNWQKFTHTWVMNNNSNNAFVFYPGWNVNEIFCIRDFKIEEGNKATGWTPAPEDIDANISSVEGKITTVSNQYTSLNQSITSLTATVNSNTTAISQKADGSSVTALNNKITEITASLDGFKSTVSSSYATKTEVSSTYATQEQVADVNAKFTDYSTTVQMNSAIEQKAASITQSVSSTYATKSSLGDYATTASVTASLALKIDKTDSKQIVSMINASANEINLKSDRFSLSSSNATISKNGTVMFKAGTIGSWNITSNSLYSDYGVYRSYIQTAKSADTWVFSAQEKRNGNYYGNWYVTADGRMYSKNKVVIDSSGKDTGSYVLMETWAKSGDKYQSKTTGLEYHTYNLTNNNHSYLQPGGLWFGNKADANIRGSIALNDSNLMLTTFDIYRTKNENGIVKGWFRDTVFVMQDGWNNNAIYADWNGNFSCTGTKNRIVETENFGQVKMNAFETAGAYFADVVSGKIAADGKCVMYLDRKFAETIDRNCEYQVILTAVGKASELYVIKDEEYFTVYGQPETDFDCIVVGRQKGYVTAYADSVDFSGFEEEVSENVIN